MKPLKVITMRLGQPTQICSKTDTVFRAEQGFKMALAGNLVMIARDGHGTDVVALGPGCRVSLEGNPNPWDLIPEAERTSQSSKGKSKGV
jgi:hypothetical protein